MRQNGFAPIVILVVVAGIVALGTVGWFYLRKVPLHYGQQARSLLSATSSTQLHRQGSTVAQSQATTAQLPPAQEHGSCARTQTTDKSKWKTYTDPVYHFVFCYPPDLTVATSSITDYGVEALLVSNPKGNRFIWLYVTTPNSIESWNQYVSSNNCAERTCDMFSYLACESSSTRCSEYYFGGVWSTTLTRRGVIKNHIERVEVLTVATLASGDVTTSTSLDDLVLSGELPKTDKEFLDTFDVIFASLMFATPL